MGSKITSAQLHQDLEATGIKMSLRTLQRALDALQKSNLGIECDKSSKPYGYTKLKRDEKLETYKLDEQVCLLLGLAQEHLEPLLPHEMKTSIEYLFNEAQESEGKAPRNLRWMEKVAVAPMALPQKAPRIINRILDAVTDGLLNDKQLLIHYKNTKGDESDRTVQPLGLVQQGERLYLVGHIVGDPPDKYQHMAIHRMQKVEVLDMGFTPPKDFSLKQYVKGRHFNYGTGELVHLSFVFSNDDTYQNLKETPIGQNQKLTISTSKKSKGKYRLTTDIENSLLLKGWIEMWKDIAGIEDIKMKPIPKDGLESQSEPVISTELKD